ncbi:MAG: outer membrane protein assembly factor BamD [Balneolaceae bacterium]
MRKPALLLIVVLVIASCRSQDLIQPGDSIQVAFDKAYSLYEQERWSDAARAFETVVNISRGTDFGRDAQFYLAESYFNNRQYIVAASEYERFANFYPNAERREVADFKRALSYYRLSPRYNLDQSYTHRAIERFRLFMERYPNSERVEEVGGYIEELRNKLARKNYNAAEFYMRTDRYNAAAVYFETVIENYPESYWAERALARRIEAYILYADNSVSARQAERYQMAIESYERYLQLFPRGENRSNVEDLYDRARTELQEIEGDTDEATARSN